MLIHQRLPAQRAVALVHAEHERTPGLTLCTRTQVTEHQQVPRDGRCGACHTACAACIFRDCARPARYAGAPVHGMQRATPIGEVHVMLVHGGRGRDVASRLKRPLDGERADIVRRDPVLRSRVTRVLHVTSPRGPRRTLRFSCQRHADSCTRHQYSDPIFGQPHVALLMSCPPAPVSLVRALDVNGETRVYALPPTRAATSCKANSANAGRAMPAPLLVAFSGT